MYMGVHRLPSPHSTSNRHYNQLKKLPSFLKPAFTPLLAMEAADVAADFAVLAADVAAYKGVPCTVSATVCKYAGE
jgi:hypothetical protein